MLRNIPSILSPDLLKYLSEMGHSDSLVICDGNFPISSIGKNSNIVRMDGHGVVEILDAILQLFPLDTYVKNSVLLMEKVKGDNVPTPIWEEIKKVVAKYDERGSETIGNIERFKFYDEAKDSYLLIATSEKALYANVMLKKGVI